MKVKISRRDNIWNILGIALSMGANFIVLPFILIYLSDDDVAIYYVFLALSSIATLFDFGFSPSVARNLNYAYSGASDLKEQGADEEKNEEPNYALMKKIIISCKILYLIIGIGALIIGSSVGTYYVYTIRTETFSSHYLYPWMVYLLAIFFNVVFSYYNVFLRGVGAVTKINLATIISRIVQIGLCILLLFLGIGLLGVAIAYLAYGFLFRMISNFLFKRHENIGKKLKEQTEKYSRNDFTGIMKKMWPNTWRDGLVTLSNYLVNQAVILIAPLFLSSLMSGIFSLATQLITAVATIASAVFNAYQPQLQSAFLNKDIDLQKRTLSLCVVAYVLLYVVVLIGLIFVGLPLIKLIKPSYNMDYFVLFGIAFSLFVLNYRNLYCSYISCTNRLMYYKAFLVFSVLCVASSYLLLKFTNLGVYALIISQLGSQLVFNAWYWSVLVHKELKMSPRYVVTIGFKSLVSMVFKSKKARQ